MYPPLENSTTPIAIMIVKPTKPPNTPEFIYSNPKVLYFNEKRLHWASPVRAHNYFLIMQI